MLLNGNFDIEFKEFKPRLKKKSLTLNSSLNFNTIIINVVSSYFIVYYLTLMLRN